MEIPTKGLIGKVWHAWLLPHRRKNKFYHAFRLEVARFRAFSFTSVHQYFFCGFQEISVRWVRVKSPPVTTMVKMITDRVCSAGSAGSVSARHRRRPSPSLGMSLRCTRAAWALASHEPSTSVAAGRAIDEPRCTSSDAVMHGTHRRDRSGPARTQREPPGTRQPRGRVIRHGAARSRTEDPKSRGGSKGSNDDEQPRPDNESQLHGWRGVSEA